MHGFLLRVPGVRAVVVFLLRQMGIYPAAFHGVTAGSYNSSTYAAANTTALEALWVLVGAAGGGLILFGAGVFALNATTLNHAQGSSPLPISVRGLDGATYLQLWGTSGTLLSIAPGATSGLIRGSWEGMTIINGQAQTSGVTVAVGSVSQYRLRNVRILATSETVGPLVCLQIGATGRTISGLELIDCKFQTRIDYQTISDNGLTPVCVDVRNDTASSGLKILNCELDGAYDSTPSPDEGYSVGLRFAGTGEWDTVIVGAGTVIKDHRQGISTSGTGAVSNVTICPGVVIDVCEDFNLKLQPPTGCTLSTWIIMGAWMASLKYNVAVDESNGGIVNGLVLIGNYATSATISALVVGSGVTNKIVMGNYLLGDNITSGSAATIGDSTATATATVVNGNIVIGGTGVTAALTVGSGEDGLAVVGNVYRTADISFGGSEDDSRLHDSNAYLA